MGTIIKPKKPTLQKPQSPSIPEKPCEHGKGVCIGRISWYPYNMAKVDDLKDICIDDTTYAQFEAEMENGWLCLENQEVYYWPKSETYHEELVDYEKKIKEHKLELKGLEPKMAEYEAAMAAYKVEILAWESQKAQKDLEKARRKVEEAHG